MGVGLLGDKKIIGVTNAISSHPDRREEPRCD